MSEAPIFIDDSPDLNSLDIRAKARRLKMDNKLGSLPPEVLRDALEHRDLHERLRCTPLEPLFRVRD